MDPWSYINAPINFNLSSPIEVLLVSGHTDVMVLPKIKVGPQIEVNRNILPYREKSLKFVCFSGFLGKFCEKKADSIGFRVYASS